MEKLIIKDDFIKLGQALKMSGGAASGLEAKLFIQDGKVKVNREVETRRGKKLYKGDIFSFKGKEFIIDSTADNNDKDLR